MFLLCELETPFAAFFSILRFATRWIWNGKCKNVAVVVEPWKRRARAKYEPLSFESLLLTRKCVQYTGFRLWLKRKFHLQHLEMQWQPRKMKIGRLEDIFYNVTGTAHPTFSAH
ncbi:hypothetical protein HN51_012640 [Arachis hypogaea]